MFKEAELKSLKGFRRGKDHIQVKCGCTNPKLGDIIGKLKVYENGLFVIDCDCTTNCPEKRVTPTDFEKHSGREGARKWKNHIWVYVNEEKVPIRKTALLKYYKIAVNEDASSSSRVRRTFHRDEFITCTNCHKQRRFRLRSQEDCRIYHDALRAKRWRCAKWPYEKITCEAIEERRSRRSLRGCPQTPACKGCKSCVCLGCLKCRFVDCNCRVCVDFLQNAEP